MNEEDEEEGGRQGGRRRTRRKEEENDIDALFYLTACSDRFLVVSKEQQMTPQGGLGRCRERVPGRGRGPQLLWGTQQWEHFSGS